MHFPAGDHEDLVIAWLWSDQAGVFSHQTALGLHGLSDALAAQTHLTLPEAWRARRRVPEGLVLHHAELGPDERAWWGAAPISSLRRTLQDVAQAGLSPDLLRQAARQALQRGLVARRELGEVQAALRPFGGLSA